MPACGMVQHTRLVPASQLSLSGVHFMLLLLQPAALIVPALVVVAPTVVPALVVVVSTLVIPPAVVVSTR